MCLNCLRDTVDVSEDINTKVTIHSCNNCGRWLGPPWQQLALESKELMVMCLRKINGLNKVKVVDAVWIWTEPHSLRLKIKLTIQKEIMTGAIVQQACVVEFIIRNRQCKHCEASFAQGAWHAVVQLRQRVPHKRTFYYLEQLILKYEAHTECIRIVTFKDGMDFYYKDKNQALRFIEFLNTHVPTRMRYSRKLVTADHSSNVGDFKHNYLIEIAPICKDDLLLLPKELAAKQSNISSLLLVKRVAAGLHLIDPLTGERTEVNSEKYWRYNFNAILSCKALTRFVVLSVEAKLHEQRASARMKRSRGSSSNPSNQPMRNVSKLAECIVARERDLGSEDTQFTCWTHLGPLLAAGDIVLGYDLSASNLNLDEKDEALVEKMGSLPDVILVRKSYEHRGARAYTLRKLDAVVSGEAQAQQDQQEADMEDFMQQVDADKEMRTQINLYKRQELQQQQQLNNKLSKSAKAAASKKARREAGAGGKEELAMRDDMDMGMDEGHDADGEYDEEEVRLEELLEDMTLSSELLQERKLMSTAEAAAQPVDLDLSIALNSFRGLAEGEEDEDL